MLKTFLVVNLLPLHIMREIFAIFIKQLWRALFLKV